MTRRFRSSAESPRLIDDLRAADLETRREAAFGLGYRGVQHDYESLEESLSAVDGLLETLLDPDPEVRAQAVFWLSQVPTEEAVVALDSILQHSTDREVQEKAIFALSQHEGERADQALRSYVRRTDTPEDLRHNAIFWLGQSGSRENMEFLKQLYDQLQSELKRLLRGVPEITIGEWTIKGSEVEVGPKDGYNYWRFNAKRGKPRKVK